MVFEAKKNMNYIFNGTQELNMWMFIKGKTLEKSRMIMIIMIINYNNVLLNIYENSNNTTHNYISYTIIYDTKKKILPVK